MCTTVEVWSHFLLIKKEAKFQGFLFKASSSGIYLEYSQLLTWEEDEVEEYSGILCM